MLNPQLVSSFKKETGHKIAPAANLLITRCRDAALKALQVYPLPICRWPFEVGFPSCVSANVRSPSTLYVGFNPHVVGATFLTPVHLAYSPLLLWQPPAIIPLQKPRSSSAVPVPQHSSCPIRPKHLKPTLAARKRGTAHAAGHVSPRPRHLN
jgi:hypothetical protein